MTRINNFLWLKRTKRKPFKYLCDAFTKTAKNCNDLLSSVEEIKRKAKFWRKLLQERSYQIFLMK